ncbi:MAG: hypothetical protein A3F70_08835 [Acidobacteria bacterium RIFCSPLOWO2_12_FULL_67_14]|nr:MAG: hypothetical protein A3H29_15550 [Acidobacteria bacterium RIFCSPLOWO2_02_FULL_67_21]OFW41472.1 MAG: hypothetical protein A3F70_08835 [Acidobacteria bacterium RIFCSPLOWO2_12_FULL_67_14]
MSKRILLAALAALIIPANGSVLAQRPATTVQVYKSPTCGCCANWVKHLQQHGFATQVTEMEDVSAVKAKYNVPDRVQSCHTAVVDGYVLEGHVPAADVQRLLKDRPAIAGLAVPGMPIGSPGMEVPSMKPQAYDVIAFDKQGQLKVFASH